MHACGHDMHQTILVATAQTLVSLKDQWKGTVLFIAQPAEETGEGARLMIEDGLFKRFPKPNYCIALHVSHEMLVGTVGYTAGWVYANVDSVDITIHGKGGHGAYPHGAIDPIVTAAHIITELQTIVSRRVNPLDHAVVTVGSIHAGTKHNVIPDTAKLELTVRSFTDDVRKEVLDSIRRIAVNTARAMGCPKDPDVVVLDDQFTPAAYNDPKLTARAAEVFRGILGDANVIERPPSMGGEDFGVYAKTLGVPGFMFQLGVVDAERFEASRKPGGEQLPTVHSAKFRVEVAPTLKTGVRCMTALALSLLEAK
jgi:hippurate hydrolase